MQGVMQGVMQGMMQGRGPRHETGTIAQSARPNPG